jgi:predicted RNase H-like HicB family nuclease
MCPHECLYLPIDFDKIDKKVSGSVYGWISICSVIEKDNEGYFAFCPELQGCYTQGVTYKEVLENAKDAIRLHIEDRIECGELIS